jgi:hypothetical protein
MQRTALMVVVTGVPADGRIERIALRLEDGDTLAVELSADQAATLRTGGVLELFHGLVEPRAQTIEVGLGGAAWPAGDRGYVTLEPARDRITLLKLDLSTVQTAQGAASIRATTWLHDDGWPPSGG